MATFMHTVRFVLGMAMLAGGMLLAHPFASAVMAVRAGRDTTTADGVYGSPDTTAPGGLPTASVVMSAAGGHAIPDGRSPVGPEAPGDSSGLRGAVAAVVPPSPPSPLPESGLERLPASPTLDGTYRSTVEMPPPPLLDAQTPPPLAAGWSTRDFVRPDVARATSSNPAASVVDTSADYVVRDGDDLTGIALRVYGHAGAATAIWTANKDRLADPQVLPIGMSLRLPPPWMLATPRGSQATGVAQAIEPSSGSAVGDGVPRDGVPNPSDMRAVRPGEDSFWLQGSATRPEAFQPISAQAAGHRPSEQSKSAAANGLSRPATVRVGLGDSLESLAVRFYGERSMASRIWMANRDRLRSPELLVPGVELRLP